jgi:hypothetical protein
MKRTGNNIIRTASLVGMMVIGTACTIPVTAMKETTIRPLVIPIAKSRILQIVDNLKEVIKANAEIADIVEQEILDGRYTGSVTEAAENVAKTQRSIVKTAKTLIQEVRERPHRFEDTDKWEEVRQALIGLAKAHNEAAHNTDYSMKLREALKQCYQIEVDFIELTNPKNQNW